MNRLSIVGAMIVGASACAFDGSNGRGGSDGPGESVDAAIGIDASDGAVVAIDAAGCQNYATHFDACAIAENTEALNLVDTGKYLYNTTDGELLDPDGNEVLHRSVLVPAPSGDIRVVLTSSFSVGSMATLRADGDYPLAIGAYGELLVTGVIDVSRGGAGARGQCNASNGMVGGDENAGAGGGGGGAFRGNGGDGGLGNGDGADQGAIGLGGAAAGQPVSPLGGCPGGDGGDGEDDGGVGGVGGGAIYLAAGAELIIEGSVDAGGVGGQGGRESGRGFADAGGGGGGSGGYILLEAPVVTVAGIVAANGGGGGEGSGDGDQGNNGAGGRTANVAATGGTGGSPTGSDGALGSAADQLNGSSVTVSEAGGAGGGGGGAGFIIVMGTDSVPGGVFSPPSI